METVTECCVGESRVDPGSRNKMDPGSRSRVDPGSRTMMDHGSMSSVDPGSRTMMDHRSISRVDPGSRRGSTLVSTKFAIPLRNLVPWC